MLSVGVPSLWHLKGRGTLASSFLLISVHPYRQQMLGIRASPSPQTTMDKS